MMRAFFTVVLGMVLGAAALLFSTLVASVALSFAHVHDPVVPALSFWGTFWVVVFLWFAIGAPVVVAA